MRKVYKKAADALLRGADVALLSVIESSGSTPRGSGAKMAVFSDGTSAGTIGGGAVEHESIVRARTALREKRSFTAHFTLTHNEIADIGMICGGDVTVYVQYIPAADARLRELVSYAAALFSRDVDSWLATRIADGEMLIYESGKGLVFANDQNADNLLPHLMPRATLLNKGGADEYYIEPINQAGVVYVFGGGHVSQELVPLLSHLDFKCVVYEDRAEFSDPALFGGAKTLLAPFTELRANIELRETDYAVIMTRGHEYDFELLEQVMRSNVCYIGVIGSRRKIVSTNARLVAAGVAQSELSRIHTPIGLPIKAETPAEIAVSIAAELIRHRAELCGK